MLRGFITSFAERFAPVCRRRHLVLVLPVALGWSLGPKRGLVHLCAQVDHQARWDRAEDSPGKALQTQTPFAIASGVLECSPVVMVAALADGHCLEPPSRWGGSGSDSCAAQGHLSVHQLQHTGNWMGGPRGRPAAVLHVYSRWCTACPQISVDQSMGKEQATPGIQPIASVAGEDNGCVELQLGVTGAFASFLRSVCSTMTWQRYLPPSDNVSLVLEVSDTLGAYTVAHKYGPLYDLMLVDAAEPHQAVPWRLES